MNTSTKRKRVGFSGMAHSLALFDVTHVLIPKESQSLAGGRAKRTPWSSEANTTGTKNFFIFDRPNPAMALRLSPAKSLHSTESVSLGLSHFAERNATNYEMLLATRFMRGKGLFVPAYDLVSFSG